MFVKMENLVEAIEDKFQDIKRQMQAGGIAQAKEILEVTCREFPESSDPLTYIRARMYEEALFGNLDIDAAIKYFSCLSKGNGPFAGEAKVGIARMLYKENPSANADSAIAYCLRAIEIEPNPRALMLMAAVYEDTKNDFESAKMWSFRAFRCRSPWGLRYIAVMFYRRKQYIRGIFYEMAVLLSRPWMLLRYEKRGPFK